MTTLMGDLQKRIEDAVGSTGTFDESLQKLANLYGIAPSSNPSRIIPVAADFDSSITTAPAALNYLLYNPDKLPTLGLDFINNTTLDSRITFTRALNTATYFNSAGLLTTANANVARFDYDPATLAPRGLLIEEARTNTLLQSRDMTQAAWVKTDVTPTRNQVGIDGVANTATLLTEGSAGTAQTQQSGAAVTAGATITASAALKKSGHGFVMLVASETTVVDGAYAIFDLTNGLVSATTLFGAGSAASASITNLGGGWYRCSVTCIPNGAYTVPLLRIRSAISLANNTRVSGATYIVDCAQLEVGAFATSIIPTTTTTLTRNADDVSITTVTPWFNAPAGAFVSSFYRPVSTTTNNTIFRIDDGTANNRHMEWIAASGAVAALHSLTGSLTTGPTTANTVTLSATNKAAYTYDASGVTVCLNAGTVPADNTLNIPTGATLTRLLIGANSTSNYLNGHMRSLSYYPRRLSNAELQAITS